MPTLIYCAHKNQFAPAALAAGFRYGLRLPGTPYTEPYFTDQDWEHPNYARYMDGLARWRPALATVLDLERPDQLDRVLSWAWAAARYVSEAVIVIPKYVGAIADLPTEVRGVPVRLGYSVETEHGSTPVDPFDFVGWRHGVHLLGGNPLLQLQLSRPHFDAHNRYVSLDVRSVDCNYIQNSAVKWCQFLAPALTDRANSIYAWRPALRWLQLKEVGWSGHNAPYEAFGRSVRALADAWA